MNRQTLEAIKNLPAPVVQGGGGCFASFQFATECESKRPIILGDLKRGDKVRV